MIDSVIFKKKKKMLVCYALNLIKYLSKQTNKQSAQTNITNVNTRQKMKRTFYEPTVSAIT
jgi:hypothetical protein